MFWHINYEAIRNSFLKETKITVLIWHLQFYLSILFATKILKFLTLHPAWLQFHAAKCPIIKLAIRINNSKVQAKGNCFPLRSCVCQIFLAFWLSRYVRFPGISTSETNPVYLPWFRMSKKFVKLTENLTETTESTGKSWNYQKYTGIFGICQK